MNLHECEAEGLDTKSYCIAGVKLIPALEVERALLKRRVELRTLRVLGLNPDQIAELKGYYEEHTGLKAEAIGKHFGL